jgi:hypothetical protein
MSEESNEQPEVVVDGDEFDGSEVVTDDPGDYQPKVPGVVRDIVYYAGIGAAAALFIWPEYPPLVRIGAAITFVGNSLAKAYRSK